MKSYSFERNQQKFHIKEAYKTLRTNISFCGSDIKVITITSCFPNDGKSDTSLNLALSIADIGKNVLLVDADLRKSTLVNKLGINDTEIKGLSHFLSVQAEAEDIIYQSNIKNFYTIFAGSFPPNPVELLSSKRFEALIKMVREHFDYIIIDTPPLGSVIDSAIISTISDGTILVIPQGIVGYKYAQKVMAQLDKSNCKVLGAILTKFAVNNPRGYYKNYYYKYKYYK